MNEPEGPSAARELRQSLVLFAVVLIPVLLLAALVRT